MITLNTTATVTNNSVLMFSLPKTLPKGEYKVLIVIEDKIPMVEPLWSLNFKGKISTKETFRREDMYNETGR